MNTTTAIMIEEATRARNATFAEMTRRVEAGYPATREQIKVIGYYNDLLQKLGAIPAMGA